MFKDYPSISYVLKTGTLKEVLQPTILWLTQNLKKKHNKSFLVIQSLADPTTILCKKDFLFLVTLS